MEKRGIKVLIMAAGTGGHVFPALSIAEEFAGRGVTVEWLGTPKGMENRILQGTDISLHRISVKGLRGSGLLRLLFAPLMLISAFIESFRVLGKTRPDLVLGMGGFVCGPAGLACRLRRIPLCLHEQNAVPGLTNKLLAPLAAKVFEAFPDTFNSRSRVMFTGNPLRSAFRPAPRKKTDRSSTAYVLRVLVLGGSQGATAINEVIPRLISQYSDSMPLETMHQVGDRHIESTEAHYREQGVEIDTAHRLVPFIDDMAGAYAWADIVVCRSGASTVSEVAAVGCPAIFVPYPHHKDQQQKLNAQWLVEEGAGLLLEQANLSAENLAAELGKLAGDRQKLEKMSASARSMSMLDASEKIVDACLEVIDVS